jgi:hypothetical protein
MKPMTPIAAVPVPEDDADADLTPLLSEPFAQAWVGPAQIPALRSRLSGRLGRSLAAEQGLTTVRRRQTLPEPLAAGALQRWLYRAPPGRSLRPGEPRSARVIELPAGAELALPAAAGACEFLVLQGALAVDAQALGLYDFLLLPAGQAPVLASAGGAQVFVREADGAASHTLVRDADAGWPEFAPGIRRRVLWSAAGQAALLYRADPGAAVPCHSHGHDEECFMVDGELFLDDVLLQRGDYQLAPAGSGHRITETDTGVVLYAHGDLDLRFT